MFLLGIQHAGAHLKELQKALKNPSANLGLVLSEAGRRAFRSVGLGQTPSIGHLVHTNLSNAAHQCAKVKANRQIRCQGLHYNFVCMCGSDSGRPKTNCICDFMN